MSEEAMDQTVLRITGSDAQKFLQDSVTNDLMSGDRLIYSAILSPQGKYLFDFFVWVEADGLLIDVATDRAAALAQRLNMYKLRADVVIEPTDLVVQRGLGDMPDGAEADPRHTSMGWRLIGEAKVVASDVDWTAIRVEHCIPETGIELIPDQTYILEAGFERLNGVDFRKGCYVGQEVTARMKHKTELRKGFATVAIDGQAEIGADILAGGKVVGQVFSQAAGKAIAYLRFDRAVGEMTAAVATVRLI